MAPIIAMNLRGQAKLRIRFAPGLSVLDYYYFNGKLWGCVVLARNERVDLVRCTWNYEIS